MKTITKKLKTINPLALILLLSPLHSLEFGTMGNLSSSMGGAGVALKSPFALYYNPALIASESKTRFGYSIGVGANETNLHNIASIDIKNLTESLTNLGKSLSGLGSVGALPGGIVPSSAAKSGARITAGSTSRANFIPSGANITNAAIMMAAAAGSTGASSNNGLIDVLRKTFNGTNGGSSSNNEDLQKKIQEWQQANKNNPQKIKELTQQFEQQVNSSNMTEAEKTLYKSLASGIDWKTLSVSGSNLSLTIKKGNNKNLDKAIDDLNSLFEMLKSNNLTLRSQNGIALTLSSGVMKRSFGSIGVGLFNNAQANASLKADPTRIRPIFGGNGTTSSGTNGGFYELVIGDGSYGFKPSSKDEYDKYSLLKSMEDRNAHKIVSSLFVLTEVPVGYAYSFYFNNANLSIGAALKYMHVMSSYKEVTLGANAVFSGLANIVNDLAQANNVGVDIGVHYEIDLPTFSDLGFGLVAKNVNYPSFTFKNQPLIVIEPQYRFGIGYNGDIYSLALDIDLWKNKLLTHSITPAYSQMIGGGVKLDYRLFDLRAGMAYDFRQDNGVILTAGANLLGFLDISIESGTKLATFQQYTFPRYFNIRFGGQFSF